MIVIVSGPPGAGKTTVAELLAAGRDRAVHLVSDEFYRWIRSGLIAPHLPGAHEQNTAVMDIVVQAVRGYSTAGYDVVWDGVVGPWWLDSVVAGLGELGSDAHWLVLRPTRTTGLDRVAARDGTTETSGAATMAEQFADLGSDERFVIPSDGDVAEVVERCRSALAAGTHRLAER